MDTANDNSIDLDYEVEIIHQHGRYMVERVELLRPAVYGGWRVRCYLKAGFVVVSSPFANEALATNAARIAMSDGVRYPKR